jgi:hypothetical protein
LSPPTELGEPLVGDALLLERRSERVTSVLGPAARAGVAADIGNRFDAMAGEQL